MGFSLTTTGSYTNTLPVPFTIMTPPYGDDGIMETVPETGPEARIKFKCLWSDHYALAQGLLGYQVSTPPSNIVYTGPYSYPPSPQLLCVAIERIEQIGKYLPFFNQNAAGLPWIARKKAIVTAVFRRPQRQGFTTSGYYSFSFAGGGEFLTLPETTYRFGDGTPTNTPIGRLIPQAEITVTRYKMGFLPDKYMIQCTGNLNNAPYTIGYNTYATGSLLFMPGNSTFDADSLGNLTYQVEYKFMFRPINWNYYLHPNRTTGFAIVTDGNGNPPYPSTSFEILP
jgi:hypothetical protein